jgi:hypothetical protein
MANDGHRFIESVQIVERGSSGVGVQTGTRYRLAGGRHETFSGGENGTFTLIEFQRYVSQGPGGNFTIRVQLHFTLTRAGDVVTEFERVDAAC